jgi:hypothetical protein
MALILSGDTGPSIVQTAALPSGSVVQVQQVSQQTRIAVSGDTKIQEINFTTRALNSKVLVIVSQGLGGVIQYTDYDLALAIGYRIGSSSSTSSDYTAINNTQYSRQNVTGLGSFFSTDTADVGGGGGTYYTDEKSYFKLISPNQAAGTVIYVSLWGSADNTWYIGSPSGSLANDGGTEGTITIMEIAG